MASRTAVRSLSSPMLKKRGPKPSPCATPSVIRRHEPRVVEVAAPGGVGAIETPHFMAAFFMYCKKKDIHDVTRIDS